MRVLPSMQGLSVSHRKCRVRLDSPRSADGAHTGEPPSSRLDIGDAGLEPAQRFGRSFPALDWSLRTRKNCLALTEPDLVIVGGGIAGCSLATVMARAGAGVLVLERQSEYRDHVRGEILWPWGVRVARLLGVEEPLLDAGAQVIRWFDLYDEGTSEPTREDAGTALRGIDGSLNIGHPSACVALAEAAASAGADVRAAAREVRVTSEASPSVEWLEPDGTRRQMRCRLIVGADGRRSSVRASGSGVRS